MAQDNLSDEQAKAVLRQWPRRTNRLWPILDDGGYWIRAQPKDAGCTAPTPRIFSAGADVFATQPDGMWCYLSRRECVDVICVEVSRSTQNFRDKRSRYSSTGHSLIMKIGRAWLREAIRLQGGGTMPRWRAAGTLDEEPSSELKLPVRYLRVVFSLPNALHDKLKGSVIAAGHEYFLRHTTLDGYNAQATQSFLRSLAPASHFRT